MSNKPGVVIVSGGSRGLGYGIVSALLRDGYYVETFSRTKTAAVGALEQGPYRERFRWREADGASIDDLTSFYHDIDGNHDAVYGLVNNAGVAVEGVLSMTSPEAIDRVVQLNLLGAIHLTRLVSKIMIRGRGGAIVNISSIIGLRGYAGLAAYGAAKAGLDGFSRALARELGPRGIRVNSVAPGYVETDMSHGLTEEQRTQIIRRTPLGRLATVDDVAQAVAFLLSAKAASITGQTLVVDGGITC